LIYNQLSQSRKRPRNPFKNQSTWPSRSKPDHKKLLPNIKHSDFNKSLTVCFKDLRFNLKFKMKELTRTSLNLRLRTAVFNQLVLQLLMLKPEQKLTKLKHKLK
jgi:hypothetical protein